MSDDLSMQAAEYVLGTLGADERAAFARLLATDSDIQALVRDWEARLAPVAGVVSPTEPGADLWSRIDAEIESIATGGNVVALRRSVARWRVATALVGSMAACLAVVAVLRGPLADKGAAPREVVAQATVSRPAPETGPAPRSPATQSQATQAAPHAPTATVTASASVVRPAQGAAASGGTVETASARPQGAGSVSLAGGADAPAGGLSVETGSSPAQPPRESQKSGWLAALEPAGAAGLIVRVDQSAGVLAAYRAGPDALDGKPVELWVLQPGRPPRAIGLLSGNSGSFQLPADVSLDGVEIAASVETGEPAADGPPSGPFVFRGRLVRE